MTGGAPANLGLTLIGYWHSEDEPFWPDPAWFVDDDWATSERGRVLTYLRGGVTPWAAAGPNWCRFRCEDRWCGSVELSDGHYLWPEGLAHYVERHGVRLPHEFVIHALDADLRAAPRRMAHGLGHDDVAVDKSWWMQQRGFRAGSSFRSPPRHGAFFARWPGGPLERSSVRLVRRFPEAQSLSVPALLEKLGSGGTVPLLSDVFEAPMPAQITELEAAGFVVEFLPGRREGQ